QPDGSYLPRTAHLTITPVTDEYCSSLCEALRQSADTVRGVPPVEYDDLLAALPKHAGALLGSAEAGLVNSEQAYVLLSEMGLAGEGDGQLPDQMATFMALLEKMPQKLGERLLIELIARVVEPRA